VALARNVFSVLDRTARSPRGSRAAFGFGGETRTFVEVRDRALAVSAALYGAGVKSGDRVAVMLGNRLEWPEVFFGLAALGAVCVPVNVLLAGPEVDHVCRDSAASCLIMDGIAEPAVAAASQTPELVVTMGGASVPGALDYETLLAGSSDLPGPTQPDLHDPFILYYSSGTTGLPKAAVHTHNGVLWNSFGQIPGLGLTPDDRYALVPSLSWAAGFHNLTLALVWIGGYSEIKPTGGTTGPELVAFLERSTATHVMLVPSLLRDLVGRPELLERLRASNLRWMVTGAEPVPRAVLEVMFRELPDIALCQGYGLSEFPTIATVLQPDETLDHLGSAGRALPHTDIAVLLESGAIADDGRGELLIRSLATMVGYRNLPEETEAALARGWLHTGDLVEVDAEGFVTILGRTKDLIISGGLNVYPKEIEDVLDRIPGVLEAAVVGIPHERFGETPVAVLRVADPDFATAVVLETCRTKLASYKRPRFVLLRTDPLPRSANGKLLKRELRPWAALQLATGAAATT
jgi:fatty-acyl-CoA synthase